MKSACSNCFKNLSIPSRVEIYKYIQSHGKATVSEVTDFIKLRQPTVSYHLKEMQNSGLLRKDLSGRNVIYRVNEVCPHDQIKCVVV